jgi:hypothetical protein
MIKLLVNTPTGCQEVIEVGNGGGYFDPSRVLWDERVDGPLPEITLGGMVRNGAALEFSQARMAEHTAASVVDARGALLSEISKIERDSMLNRGSRELEMRLIEREAAIIAAESGGTVTAEQILAGQPYYVKLVALNSQIAVLRGQLG